MRRLSVLLLAAPVLILVYVSMNNILDAWVGSDVKLVANIIETSPKRDSIYFTESSDLGADFFEQFERGHDLDKISSVCIDDYSRSALTVRLFSLYSLWSHAAPEKKREIPLPKSAITGLFESAERRNAGPSLSVPDSVDVMRKAQLAKNATEQRILCSPTDGNAWLWRAALLSKFFEDRQRSVSSYQFSYWLAPSEKWVMDQRSRLVGELIDAGNQELSVEFSSELGRIVRYFPVSDAVALFAEAGPKVRGVFVKEVLKTRSKRQTQIAEALDGLGFTLR